MVKRLFFFLSSALILSVINSSCSSRQPEMAYNLSSLAPLAESPYAVQQEDTVYFTSFYQNLYCYDGMTVTLLKEGFTGRSMTMLDGVLYYLDSDSFCRLILSGNNPPGEPETIYTFSTSSDKAWTDGESAFALVGNGIICAPLGGGTETFWEMEYLTSHSALVWDGQIYLNEASDAYFNLTAVDLETREKRVVSELPTIAYGVADNQLCLREAVSDSDAPVPFTAGNGVSYAYDIHSVGSINTIDLYIQVGNNYIPACTIPYTRSVLSPAAYQAGDSLLIRSYFPAEADRSLAGEQPYGPAVYQYILNPNGELTLLVKEEIVSPLS